MAVRKLTKEECKIAKAKKGVDVIKELKTLRNTIWEIRFSKWLGRDEAVPSNDIDSFLWNTETSRKLNELYDEVNEVIKEAAKQAVDEDWYETVMK